MGTEESDFRVRIVYSVLSISARPPAHDPSDAALEGHCLCWLGGQAGSVSTLCPAGCVFATHALLHCWFLSVGRLAGSLPHPPRYSALVYGDN